MSDCSHHHCAEEHCCTAAIPNFEIMGIFEHSALADTLRLLGRNDLNLQCHSFNYYCFSKSVKCVKLLIVPLQGC